jgi:hypothetical protein
MNGFSYARSPLERLELKLPPMLGGAFRMPLVTLGAALVLGAATATIEAQRLSALDSDLGALITRERAAAPAATAARQIVAAIARDRELADRVIDGRRSAMIATNMIARLGNALPAQTWLTNVQQTATGTWTIAGRSVRVAEIATTLRTIAALDARSRTQLVSVSATGRSGHVLDFVIGWERRP